MLGFRLQDLSVFTKCVYTYVSVFLKWCLYSYLDKLTMFWGHFLPQQRQEVQKLTSLPFTKFCFVFKTSFNFGGSNYNVKLLFSVWLYFLLVPGENIHCLHIPFGHLWTKCCTCLQQSHSLLHPHAAAQPGLLFLPSRVFSCLHSFIFCTNSFSAARNNVFLFNFKLKLLSQSCI